MFFSFTLLISGVGWNKTHSQAAPDWGESREKEEGGDGSDAAGQARAGHSGVGADQIGNRGPPTHQCPGLQLETEAQVPGKLLVLSRGAFRQSTAAL